MNVKILTVDKNNTTVIHLKNYKCYCENFFINLAETIRHPEQKLLNTIPIIKAKSTSVFTYLLNS